MGIAPDQITEIYEPNGFGETLHYGANGGGQSVYTTDFTRDTLGRIATKSESLLNADASVSAASFTYNYDAAGRLTHAVAGDGTHAHYDYDANGNRLRRFVQGPSGNSEELATYGVGDQLLSYNGRTFTYTASGMLESTTDTSGTTNYTYDALGHLRTVALPSGKTIDYVIDGQNHRVGKKVNNLLMQAWLYQDALRISAEIDFDGMGNVTDVKRFGYASKGNVPDLMVTQNAVRYRILSDDLGSPRMVLYELGVVYPASMEYDEFGRVLVNQQPGLLPFGFAGGLYDPDTGLVRFGARDYDPETGRWTTKDPVRFAGGANLYLYANGDPVNMADLDGLDPGDCYASPLDAALHGLADYNFKSILLNVEFAGLIYDHGGGCFSYTAARFKADPKTGAAAADAHSTSRPFSTRDQCDPNDILVGDYHTHAAYSAPTDEQFSPTDMQATRALGSNTLFGAWTSYLATPSGRIGIYSGSIDPWYSSPSDGYGVP